MNEKKLFMSRKNIFEIILIYFMKNWIIYLDGLQLKRNKPTFFIYVFLHQVVKILGKENHNQCTSIWFLLRVVI